MKLKKACKYRLFYGVNSEGVEPCGFNASETSGVDGSRTRVQKSIPCPSTIIADSFGFPPADGKSAAFCHR